MKKKGFTLVELLAVIAILAILVIIALPNVMGMFNTAKKNSFATEVKEVFKTAQQQWILDNMTTAATEITYKRYNAGTDSNPNITQCQTVTAAKDVDMSGRQDLLFEITFGSDGTVYTYKATDGTYEYSYSSSSTGLKVEDIKNDDIKVIADDGVNVTISGC